MHFNVVRPGEYHFLFMAKGGGSANKTFLYQQTKALLNPASLMAFLEEKIKSLGTAACPPCVFSLMTATPRRRARGTHFDSRHAVVKTPNPDATRHPDCRYHLAIVVGGLSAELTLKTVKLASAK